MSGGERADAVALEYLELVVRELGDELAGWRARALKAETDLKGNGGRSGRGDAEPRDVSLEVEAENRVLRQRIDAARERVTELVSRLTFLEEQARVTAGGNGSGR